MPRVDCQAAAPARSISISVVKGMTAGIIRRTPFGRPSGLRAIKPLPPMYPGAMRIGAEEEKAVLDVLRSKRLFRYYGPYSGDSKVDEFEKAFATYMETGHAVAMSSGTASLICGLAALGVGPGDEVIVPAYTWIASAEAVIAVGAVPIPAEIDQSLTLDAADVSSRITGRYEGDHAGAYERCSMRDGQDC